MQEAPTEKPRRGSKAGAKPAQSAQTLPAEVPKKRAQFTAGAKRGRAAKSTGEPSSPLLIMHRAPDRTVLEGCKIGGGAGSLYIVCLRIGGKHLRFSAVWHRVRAQIQGHQNQGSAALTRSRCTRKLSSMKGGFLLCARSPCLRVCITKGCLLHVAGHEPASEEVSAGAVQSPAPKRSRRTRKLSDMNEAAAAAAEEDFQVRCSSCIVV